MPNGTKITPFIKDPDAVKDYGVTWATWLATVSDTIATSAWSIITTATVPPLVIDSEVNSTTVATVWLSGGLAGTRYALRNRVTTAGGRTDDQTVYVEVRER